MLQIKIATTPSAVVSGKTPGQWHIRAINAGGTAVINVMSDAPNTPWNDALEHGVYTLVGERLYAEGGRHGVEVSGSFDWQGDANAEMADAPAAISVGAL